MHKKILTIMIAIIIIATIGFMIGPMQNATSAYASDNHAGKKFQKVTRDVPDLQWFHLKGVTLQQGEFLDLVDTTPFLTTRDMLPHDLPCDAQGVTQVKFLQGIVDVGVNTLTPADPEYLPQLSTPGQNCLYHFDIGTSNGVTDFAVINAGSIPITFRDRNTIPFSIAEGLKQLD